MFRRLLELNENLGLSDTLFVEPKDSWKFLWEQWRNFYSACRFCFFWSRGQIESQGAAKGRKEFSTGWDGRWPFLFAFNFARRRGTTFDVEQVLREKSMNTAGFAYFRASRGRSFAYHLRLRIFSLALAFS
jgi:hypothetical protein